MVFVMSFPKANKLSRTKEWVLPWSAKHFLLHQCDLQTCSHMTTILALSGRGFESCKIYMHHARLAVPFLRPRAILLPASSTQAGQLLSLVRRPDWRCSIHLGWTASVLGYHTGHAFSSSLKFSSTDTDTLCCTHSRRNSPQSRCCPLQASPQGWH